MSPRLRVLALFSLATVAALLFVWTRLPDSAHADSTGFRSPTALHQPIEWTVPDRAFVDDGTEAEETTNGDEQGYADFGLAVPAGAIVIGIEVRLDAFSDDTDGCQLGVSLSGDDGGSYTAQKIVDLTNIETTFRLGGSTDTWGEDWTSSELSDAEFVAKVAYVDPDKGDDTTCTDGARAFLDHIQVNAYFKTTTSTALRSPSATHAPNDWTDPENAFTSNNADATSDVDDEDQGYAEFNLNVPAASIVLGIEVQVEAASEDDAGCELQVRLSGDDGATFTTRKTADLTDSDTVHTLGGPDDLWGADWSPGQFSDATFVLEVRNNDPDADCDDGSETSLDHVQVRVFYKPLQQTGLESPSGTLDANDWTNPDNAFADDDIDATSDTDGEEQGYAEFGFSIPGSAIITGIEVRVRAASDDVDGCQLHVRLSGDGGATYSDFRVVDLTNVETLAIVGGPDDAWLRTWTPSELSDANFVAKVTNVDPDAACDGGSVAALDHLQVNVFYKLGDDTAFRSPSATPDPNDWTDPENGFSSNNMDATSNADGEEQGYGEFGFSIPVSAIVSGVEVRVEAASDDSDGCELEVRLSGDAGATYSDPRTVDLTNVEAVRTAGGTSDTWGTSWSPDEFDDDNFVAKVTNVDPDPAADTVCTDGSTTSLDHIQVNVYTKVTAPTSTPTFTATATATETGTPTATATATETATATSTPTVTNTPTATEPPTNTPTRTNTPTPTESFTPTVSNTPTHTATATGTSTRTPTPTRSKPLGDVNSDLSVDSIDALLILQFDARLLSGLQNPESGDLNGDGDINSLDASIVLQIDAALISGAEPGGRSRAVVRGVW